MKLTAFLLYKIILLLNFNTRNTKLYANVQHITNVCMQNMVYTIRQSNMYDQYIILRVAPLCIMFTCIFVRRQLRLGRESFASSVVEYTYK